MSKRLVPCPLCLHSAPITPGGPEPACPTCGARLVYNYSHHDFLTVRCPACQCEVYDGQEVVLAGFLECPHCGESLVPKNAGGSVVDM